MVKGEIKVSVISPIYNTPEKMLRNNIEHLISQTLKEIEIILVDDGSKKEISDICDEYARKDSRIIVIHQANSGVSCSRNAGLRKTSGKYVIFIDSDDYIEEDCLEILYRKAENSDYVAVFSGKIKEYKNVVVSKSKYSNIVMSLPQDIKGFLEDPLEFSCCGALIKGNIARKNVFDCSLKYGEDTLFMFNVLSGKRFFYLGNNKYHYLTHEGNTMNKSEKNDVYKRIEDFSKLLKILNASSNFEQTRLADVILKRKINVALKKYIQYQTIEKKSYGEICEDLRTKYCKNSKMYVTGNIAQDVLTFLFLKKMYGFHYSFQKLILKLNRVKA